MASVTAFNTGEGETEVELENLNSRSPATSASSLSSVVERFMYRNVTERERKGEGEKGGEGEMRTVKISTFSVDLHLSIH